MAIKEHHRGESGLTVRGRLVTAMRAVSASGVTRFDEYTGRNGTPEYEITTSDGTERSVASSEVAAYVVAHRDAYLGLRQQIAVSYDNAMASNSVVDRESLIDAVLSDLDARCGDHLVRAAEPFNGAQEREPVAA